MILTPEEEVAGKLRRERKPPCRLIYAMVAVLSVRTRTSLKGVCGQCGCQQEDDLSLPHDVTTAAAP